MKKHRLTLELDDRTYKKLEELEKELGETSKAGVFRTAIALLLGISDDIFVNGSTLGIIKDGKIEKEVLVT